MAVIGYTGTGRKWAPELEVSTLEAPAEQFVLDTSLKPIGVDPRFPTDILVIPKGRLVGVNNGSVTSGSGATTLNASFVDGDTVLTLADGVNVAPLGFAGYNMFMKRSADTAQWAPAMFKSRLIRLPYTTTAGANAFSNAMYGDIAPGDAITAYNGGTTTALGRHKGKIVKYVPKQVYSTWSVTASTVILLTDATLRAFTPKVIAAFGTTGITDFTAASGTTTGSLGGDTIGTVAWNTAGYWQVTLSAVANCVVWQYGQDDFMKAGTCLGIEKLDSDMSGWLKWVTDNFGMWDLPPIQLPGYTTAATITTGSGLTAVSAASTNNQWSIDAVTTSHPFANYKPYTITLADGCLINSLDGATTITSVAGTTFLVENVNFTINPITGTITILNCTQSDGTAIEASDITMTYYYENPKNGLLYDGGQLYLTDGSGGTYAGVPAGYDIAGSVGIMKVMVE